VARETKFVMPNYTKSDPEMTSCMFKNRDQKLDRVLKVREENIDPQYDTLPATMYGRAFCDAPLNGAADGEQSS
jgi:hypothetical protein